MRIIRVLLATITLVVILVPQVVSAVEAEESNETKINFEIEDNFLLSDGVIKSKYDLFLLRAPYNFEGYVPVKTPREIQLEKVMLRYEEKRRQASLPRGKFIINASAYTAAADECGKSDGITASGLMVREKETIACPPQFPFGTKLKIEGMGTYMCQDRGGAIKGNHIDIYMETKKEAFAFGRRNLLAEVVK